MAELPPWLLQECFSAIGVRLFTGNLVCSEGVADVGAGSLLVTTGGAGLDLSVAEGGGFVDSDVDDKGMYSVFNDAAETVTATTADATNPRIDQVIATVNDAQIAGVDNNWVLSVLAGTPTGGANLTNLTGAAALPDRSIRLAYVLVPALFAGPFVDATHILDARTPYGSCEGWQSYTPVWTNTGALNLSHSRWIRHGDMVTVQFYTRFNAGGAAATATMSLPIPAANPQLQSTLGVATYELPVGTRTNYIVNLASPTTVNFYEFGSDTPAPGPTSVDGRWFGTFSYEIA